jgi:hypothetical protein
MQTDTGSEAKSGPGVSGGDVASEPGWKVRHDQKVAAIVERVRELAQLGARIHVDKGGQHHVVPLPGDPRFKTRPVDISSLDEILEIDVAQRRCVAEPGVSFAQLARATLAHGLLPKVVPELEGITIGGAVAGCSIEAMSYKYGGFHDNCLEYEVVSGTGEVVTCSKEHEPDVFEMIHGSYGTLGILTRLTFDLVEATPYVRMEYRRYASAEEFYEAMRSCCESGCADFIDGIIHGPDEHVLCLGNFVDKAPYVSSYRWLNIFYKSTRFRDVDYLSTFDYCFRYDTECHWLTRTVPPLEWKPVRLLVGKWLLGSTNLIRWSNRLERVLGMKKRPDVVVDVFIPAPHYVEFFEWYDRDFDFYPLWIVPYRVPEVYPWISEALEERMPESFFIDCAVYGRPNSEPDVDYSQLLEEKTFELAGIKTLISRNHYTPERFWEIYNRPNYEAAKARLDPDGAFPDLYEAFGRVE